MTFLEHVSTVFDGANVSAVRPLSGGCVGDVLRFDVNGETYVAKVGDSNSGLDIEGRMLDTLSELSSLPVPKVVHAEPSLLVMTFVTCDGRGDADVHAAELLGALHEISGEMFGLHYDTLIGGLHQPNDESDSWINFFGEQRLRFMTRTAIERGRLDPRYVERMESMITRLPDLLEEPESPSLIHGDIWGGNVMVDAGRVAAFIDPAIYFAHYEMELAFIGMFHTFGQRFYDAYPKTIDRAFFDTRRDIYNLYPLLVHVSLFGGGYVNSVDRTLRRFNC